MIERLAKRAIIDALGLQAAVAILGPRQVGKTTLALEVAENRPSLYLDLESPTDRQKLQNPELYFEMHQDKLIILDEIHRVPELFQTLRGVIDRGRRQGLRTGRFLMLGSASIDLLKQSGESLAGRLSYTPLTPIMANEVDEDLPTLQRLWLRGGFPDSYLARTDEQSVALRRDFIRTYLERDIPMFGTSVPAETMERFWTMLAHNQGQLLNTSELARALSLSTTSVNRYIDLLVDLLLVRRLQPYHTNVGKRLVKSPKVYIRDSGLTHCLLNIESLDRLAGHPVVGNSWEGFVVETIINALPWRTQAFFYRTAAGAEMDLVLEHADGSLWAIEIKLGLAPKLTKGFYNALEDLKPAKAFVVYAGSDRYPINELAEVVGLQGLLSELKIL